MNEKRRRVALTACALVLFGTAHASAPAQKHSRTAADTATVAGQTLDNVVVTGYGNMRKSNYTGAASVVDSRALENVPAVSFVDRLAGQVPGLEMGNSSSAPGGLTNLRIRGLSSVNASNEPLYVIDGTPVMSENVSRFNGEGTSAKYNAAGTSVLATINPNDIESVTVIKDAAAASLYGSRAANGVIVITTKKGSRGKTRVRFNSDWGFSNMAIDYRPQLSGEDRRELLYHGLLNYAKNVGKYSDEKAITFADNNIDKFAAMPKNGYTDWKDLLFRTGRHQNYQVSVQGGNERTMVYASLGYLKQGGIIENQDLERMNGSANVNHKFGRFELNVNTMLSRTNQNAVGEGSTKSSVVANWLNFQSPSSDPYDEDGNLQPCGLYNQNPLFEQQHRSDLNVVTRALNGAQLTYRIWDRLKASGKVTYDYVNSREDILWDKESGSGTPSGVLMNMTTNYEQLNTQWHLTYDRAFGNHYFDVLAGFETEDYQYHFTQSTGQNFPGNEYVMSSASTTVATAGSGRSRLASWLARANYNYNQLYYVAASFRTDGSSRFGADNRWGKFWSVSGAWRFGQEDFLGAARNVLTDGKLRVSYGINGNLPQSYYGSNSYYYYRFPYAGEKGFAVLGVGNKNLKWEKNKQLNIGLDLELFNRLSITADYYVRNTDDLLFNLPISATAGLYNSSNVPYALTNIGEMRNRGFELTVTSVNIENRDWTWTTTLNLAHNRNEVVKLDGQSTEIVDGNLIYREGERFYSYYAYEYAGVDRETGKELYYINDGTDKARETTTDYKKAQKTIIGHHDPTVSGGLSNTVRWRMIDLGVNLTFSLGGDALDNVNLTHTNGGTNLYRGGVPSYYKLSDTWTPENKDAKLPIFQYNSTSVMSSRWLMPTDYLRLKSLTLGVSAPQEWLRPIGLSKARVFFSGSNLLTWKSKDLYVDPEMPVSGLCTVETPAYRTYTFGLELEF